MNIHNHAKHVTESLGLLQEQVLRIEPSDHLPVQHQVALALLRFAFDHATFITLNLHDRGSSSAGPCLALLRPMDEAMLRGAWFAFCATESQARSFRETGKIPRAKTLAKALEARSPFNTSHPFSQKHKDMRNHLNDFVHGGKSIVNAYLAGRGVGAAFSEKDIHKVLSYTEIAAMVVIQLVANICGTYDAEKATAAIISIGNMKWSGHDFPT